MSYDIHVSGPERRALFDLRGAPEVLSSLAPGVLPEWPDRPCTWTQQGDRMLMWPGLRTWLLMAPMSEEARLDAALCGQVAPEAGVTLISDTHAFFAVSGGDADVAMAIACPLDLHPGAFGPQACARTDAFGVRALVLRQDAGWLLGVEAAYADYIAAHLVRIV